GPPDPGAAEAARRGGARDRQEPRASARARHRGAGAARVSAAGERGRVAQGLGVLGLTDFVLLNPGGGWANKRWPAESFGRLAARLREQGHRPLVTFGPGEEALADEVVRASGDAAVRGFGTTLLEFVELARRARLVVAADTGPLHIACAVGVPVVGIYGPTDPARNGPFLPLDVVVRRQGPPDPRHRGRFRVGPA